MRSVAEWRDPIMGSNAVQPAPPAPCAQCQELSESLARAAQLIDDQRAQLDRQAQRILDADAEVLRAQTAERTAKRKLLKVWVHIQNVVNGKEGS